VRIAEITRQDTSQRAQLISVESYDIQLDLTGGAPAFGSVSVIRFDCRQPGAASYADLIAQTVHEITLNGTSLDPATVCAEGRIMLPSAGGPDGPGAVHPGPFSC
jgi:aminopeptidase N